MTFDSPFVVLPGTLARGRGAGSIAVPPPTSSGGRVWSTYGPNGQLPVGVYGNVSELEGILGRSTDFKGKSHWFAGTWAAFAGIPGNIKWYIDNYQGGAAGTPKGHTTGWHWPGATVSSTNRYTQFVQCANNQLVEGKYVSDWLKRLGSNIVAAGFSATRPLFVNLGMEWNAFWFGWSRHYIGSAQLHKDAYHRMYTDIKSTAGDAVVLMLASLDFAVNQSPTTQYTWASTFNEWMPDPQYNDIISYDWYAGSGMFGDGKPYPTVAQQQAVWSRMTTGVNGDTGPLNRVVEFADRTTPKRGICIAEFGVSRVGGDRPEMDGWHTSSWFSEQYFRWMRLNGVWPQFFQAVADGDSRVRPGTAEATLVNQHFGPNPVAL